MGEDIFSQLSLSWPTPYFKIPVSGHSIKGNIISASTLSKTILSNTLKILHGWIKTHLVLLITREFKPILLNLLWYEKHTIPGIRLVNQCYNAPVISIFVFLWMGRPDLCTIFQLCIHQSSLNFMWFVYKNTSVPLYTSTFQSLILQILFLW